MYKRLIASIAVKDEIAVQSFGFRSYLPLGNPVSLAKNYARWGADEIHLVDISATRARRGPNYDLIKRVANAATGTPLIYGGGIKNSTQAIQAVAAGADRLSLDNCLVNGYGRLKEISFAVGAQALIASVPFKCLQGNLHWYDYSGQKLLEDNDRQRLLNEVIPEVSEVLLIDVEAEGSQGEFQVEAYNLLGVERNILLKGGLPTDDQINSIICNESVNGVVYGNPLVYGENMIGNIKLQFKEAKARFENT